MATWRGWRAKFKERFTPRRVARNLLALAILVAIIVIVHRVVWGR